VRSPVARAKVTAKARKVTLSQRDKYVKLTADPNVALKRPTVKKLLTHDEQATDPKSHTLVKNLPTGFF
jgi:hypothetical protein